MKLDISVRVPLDNLDMLTAAQKHALLTGIGAVIHASHLKPIPAEAVKVDTLLAPTAAAPRLVKGRAQSGSR